MAFDPSDEKNINIIMYCVKYKILLVSDSKGTRASLKAFAKQIGFKADSILVAANFGEANTYIEEENPSFIISDFNIGSATATPLFEKIKQKHLNPLERGLILIENTNVSLAATRFYELEMDLLLNYPLTVDSLIDNFLKVILPKLAPTENDKLLALLEESYYNENYDKCFEYAESLIDLKHRLGKTYYYKAMTEKKQKNDDKYLECLLLSVENQPPFYSSLNLLFEYYAETKRDYESAFLYMNRLLEIYPTNPNKIAQITKIFLANGHYEEIVKYCDQILNWHDQDHNKTIVKNDQIVDDLIGNITVCLFAAAKYAIKIDNIPRAVEILEGVADTGKNHFPILKKVIKQVVDLKDWKVADKLLKKVDPSNFDIEMETIRFKVDDQSLPAGESLKLGVILLSDGVKEKELYEIIIRRSIEVGRRREIIEDYISDAIHFFPDDAEMFEKFR
jgi:tetratricopeptide (TPR) repeat protein